MPISECPKCHSIVPNFRRCTNCGSQVNPDLLPPEQPDKEQLTEKLHEPTSKSANDSASPEKLQSDHDKYDRKLVDYLYSDEEPCALYECSIIEISRGDESWSSIPAGMFGKYGRGHLLITSRRLVCVFPRDGQAQVAGVPYRRITEVQFSNSLATKPRLDVDATDGCTYRIDVYDRNNPAEMLRLVENRYTNFETEESRAERLDNSIDDIVADSDTAAGAFQDLLDLFDDTQTLTRYDQIISEAENLSDVIEVIYAKQQPTGSQPTEESLPTTVQNDQEQITQQSEVATEGINPKKVGKWALGTVIGGSALAVSAPFSTTLGLGALLVGGGSAGVFASAKPESAINEVDPIRTAINLRTGGLAHKRSNQKGGYGTGVALTALDQTDAEDVPPSVAKWVTKIDADTVARDAELAVEAADRSPRDHNDRMVRMLGGTVGVAHSYVNSGDGSDLEEILDEDLYREIAAELEG